MIWKGSSKTSRLLQDHQRNPNHPPPGAPPDAATLVSQAITFWRNPALSSGTLGLLGEFALRALADATADWEQKAYPALVENALRQLIAVSPDLQTA